MPYFDSYTLKKEKDKNVMPMYILEKDLSFGENKINEDKKYYCKKCKKEIDEMDATCPYCGTIIF